MDDIATEVRAHLEAHGFPVKLLPDCMVDGELDEGSGAFRVDLSRTHDAEFDGIPVHYEKRVAGTITTGKITGLSGVKAKKGFLWVSVPTILAEGSDLVFKVGPIRKAIARHHWE